ncbi:branched-chain amino acid ABC transporter permease [Microvirga antarctica]|uniref:branched-chain amino acid ABC transporter permease n=1 Tax=Microvirga antarctica TaxID=2819233 RepID=UPI001B314CE6|nr:branched-chain amino acid ABC transporter permease [Microvirga antarctica]
MMNQPASSRSAAMIAVAVLAIIALAVPRLAPNEFILSILGFAMIYAMLAASWDLLIGFAGLVSFGHAGFFGLGGYAAALATYHFGLSPWLGLPIGGLAGGVFGILIGIPTLRLRAVYLALATLAFAESLRIIATNWHDLTRGSLGFNLHPTFFRLSGEAANSYYVVLLVSSLSIAVIYYIARHTSLGMTFQAVRDDELRARSLGIDVVRHKIAAFALSGFFAGVAGALYAHYLGLISPSELGPATTMLVVAMSTIGGIGTIIGPALAAIVLYLASELLRMIGSTYGQVAIGALLIFFVILFPEGVAGWLSRQRASWRNKRKT